MTARNPHAHWVVWWKLPDGSDLFQLLGDGEAMHPPRGAELHRSKRFTAQDLAWVETDGRSLLDVLVEMWLRPAAPVMQAAE